MPKQLHLKLFVWQSGTGGLGRVTHENNKTELVTFKAPWHLRACSRQRDFYTNFYTNFQQNFGESTLNDWSVNRLRGGEKARKKFLRAELAERRLGKESCPLPQSTLDFLRPPNFFSDFSPPQTQFTGYKRPKIMLTFSGR